MFNKNLKRIRLKNGLSQKEVADFLSISPQSVSKWEKGEALPSIEYLPKLAEVLSCDINAFFVPVEANAYDLEMLNEFFSFMACIFDETKKIEDFYPFWCEHPNIGDIIENLGEELKQYQTIKLKTLQGILGCTENEAVVFLNHFMKMEFLEKMEANDNYFVIKSAIDGLNVALKAMIIACKLMADNQIK